MGGGLDDFEKYNPASIVVKGKKKLSDPFIQNTAKRTDIMRAYAMTRILLV